MIIIEIENGELKPYVEDGEDLSEEQEKEFHNQFHKLIENKLHDEDFEEDFFNEWIHEAEFLNPKAKEFSDLFNGLSIKISQEHLKGAKDENRT